MNVIQNILILLLAQLLLGQISAQNSASYVDVSGELGLHYPLRTADNSAQYLHHQFPSDPIYFDFDGDSDLDLLLPYGYALADSNMLATNLLYANTDTGWTDITVATGLNLFGPSGNAAVGDINGDGYLDIYLCNLGEDRLLLNVEGQYFKDITATLPAPNTSWSSAAVFFDANLDGKLDLYVANYLIYDANDSSHCMPMESGEPVDCDPQLFDAAMNRFYYGDGLGGFTDASSALSVREQQSRSLQTLLIDANGDQALDLLVLSYRAPNLLYLSDTSGGMQEAALISGLAVAADGTEPVWTDVLAADLNNDEAEDLLLVDNTGRLHIMLNDGAGHYFSGEYQSGFFSAAGLEVIDQLVSTDFNFDGFDDLLFITSPALDEAGNIIDEPVAPGVAWVRSGDGSQFVRAGNWQPIRIDTSILIWGAVDSTADSLDISLQAQADTTFAYESNDFQAIDSLTANTDYEAAQFEEHFAADTLLPSLLDSIMVGGMPRRMISVDLDGDGKAEIIASYGYGVYHVWQQISGVRQKYVEFYFATNDNGTSPIGGILEIATPEKVHREIVKDLSSRVIFLNKRQREIEVTFTWLDGVTLTLQIDSFNQSYRLWAGNE